MGTCCRLLQQVCAADARTAAAEEEAEAVKRESDARASIIRWLEAQLVTAQDAAAAATRRAQQADTQGDQAAAQAAQGCSGGRAAWMQ